MPPRNSLHVDAAAAIEAIEAELRRLGYWQDKPLDPAQLDFQTAFAADTMAFTQWLQFVLVPRVRQIIAERGQFPSSSHVGALAVREFDGNHDTGPLIDLLIRFDDLFGSHDGGANAAPVRNEPVVPKVRGHITLTAGRHDLTRALWGAGIDVVNTPGELRMAGCLRLTLPEYGDTHQYEVMSDPVELDFLLSACRRTSSALRKANLAHRIEVTDDHAKLAGLFEHPLAP